MLLLIFDADDTLWESNALFERALSGFVSWSVSRGHDADAALATFRKCELENTTRNGTGHGVFAQTLRQTCEALGGRELSVGFDDHLPNVVANFEEIGSHLYQDVVPALDALSTVASMVMMTRGNSGEQTAKIARSGLAHFFQRVFIVKDKTDAEYAEVLSQLAADPDQTWMVGNSMKHDVIPALAAGLGAVHVDRGPGWALERATAPKDHERLVTVPDLASLPGYFRSM